MRPLRRGCTYATRRLPRIRSGRDVARLPESWIAPEHIRQWRSRLHLRKALIDERTQWLLRIRSTLYHHGLSLGAAGEISGPRGREFLASLPLPLDASQRVVIARRMIDMLGAQIPELERELRTIARHQAGCQALMTHRPLLDVESLQPAPAASPKPTIGGDPDKDRAAAVAPRDDRSTITSRPPQPVTDDPDKAGHGARQPLKRGLDTNDRTDKGQLVRTTGLGPAVRIVR